MSGEAQQIGRSLFRRDGKLEYLGKVLPPGPWHDEPDHVEFRAEGFPCLLHRGPAGAWCGYVGVPPGHPWHGKSGFGESEYIDARVHGGITYGNACQVDGPICHKPAPGEPDDVWWLGFDCNHLGDLSAYDLAPPDLPGFPRWSMHHGTYRTVDYVRRETERLANQARSVSP